MFQIEHILLEILNLFVSHAAFVLQAIQVVPQDLVFILHLLELLLYRLNLCIHVLLCLFEFGLPLHNDIIQGLTIRLNLHLNSVGKLLLQVPLNFSL